MQHNLVTLEVIIGNFIPCICARVIDIVHSVHKYLSYQYVALAIGNFTGWFIPDNYYYGDIVIWHNQQFKLPTTQNVFFWGQLIDFYLNESSDVLFSLGIVGFTLSRKGKKYLSLQK